jgi:LysM repeat protein
MLFFSIIMLLEPTKRKSLKLLMAVLMVCMSGLAYAQPTFEGAWNTQQALQTWIGGDFHTNLLLADKIDASKAHIAEIDSCVAHRYTGQLPLAEGDVFSFVLGRHFFEAENARFCWLVAATTDGYACKDCGMALSGALWEQPEGSNTWSVVFQERDFAVTGAAGVPPQVAFAAIGKASQIGLFVWQRRSQDEHQHFYLADIYALLDNHFTAITRGNSLNDASLPNICNAVGGDERLPYSYEADYEFQENQAFEVYDVNVRKQGTIADNGAILPLDRTYFYHWNTVKAKYQLMDSVDNVVFVPFVTTKNESLKTIALQKSNTVEELKGYNPALADGIIPPNTKLFVRKLDLSTQGNLSPSFASIEAAVGVPDDEKGSNDGQAQDTAPAADEGQAQDIAQTDPTAETNQPKAAVTEMNVPTQRKNTHTVQPRETLFAIAQKYHLQMTDLQRINGLPEDFSVKQGQVLDLGESPFLVENPPAPAPEIASFNDSTSTSPITKLTHKVAEGETLFAISRKYKVSVGHLQKLNHLKDYVVMIGQVLVIQ